jgi:predicted transcriptional regulator
MTQIPTNWKRLMVSRIKQNQPKMNQKQKTKLNHKTLVALRNRAALSLEDVASLVDHDQKEVRSSLNQLCRDGFVLYNLVTGKYERVTRTRK